jgi:hypothetical protein
MFMRPHLYPHLEELRRLAKRLRATAADHTAPSAAATPPPAAGGAARSMAAASVAARSTRALSSPKEEPVLLGSGPVDQAMMPSAGAPGVPRWPRAAEEKRSV